MLEHDLAVGITFKSLRKKENVTTEIIMIIFITKLRRQHKN